MIEVKPLTGGDLQEALPALADLRIRVFREWPYLYEGTLEYEKKYLKKFSAEKEGILVVAKDGNKIVGASTASPLLGHADAFAKPFADQGYEPEKVFYFGESVLLPEYRGQGIGHMFFEEREKHARNLGKFNIASFCAVVRADNDLRKPAAYRPLENFWHKRGFKKADGLVTQFVWKEPEKPEEVSHFMQFWIKNL